MAELAEKLELGGRDQPFPLLKNVDINTCGSIHVSYADKRIVVVVVVETERFMKKSASTAGTRLRAHFAQLAGAHLTECLSERPLRPKCTSS